MCMVSNVSLVVPIVVFVIGIILLVLNHIFDWWWDEDWPTILIIVVMALCFVWGLLAYGISGDVWVTESSIYAERISEYNTITNILNNTTDVVNSDVYLKAIEYNSNIEGTKAMLENPSYSIFASHCDCDWANLPLIEIP